MEAVLATRPHQGPGAGAEPGPPNPDTVSPTSIDTIEATPISMRERAEALQAQLAERVAAITTAQEWMSWIQFARRMHRNRSLNNQLLIWMQDPDATWCLGFRAWQGHKRWVRKGEKGIRIWAPVTTKTVSEEGTDDSESVRSIAGFRLATVFDIRQTDGHNPMPEPPLPVLLAGNAPALL
jgi:DNA primase